MRFSKRCCRRLVAAALVAATTACGSIRVPLGPPAADAGDVRLVGRLLADADARRVDVALLDSALRHPSAIIRRTAAATAGHVSARAVARQLAERAADADTGVAGAASFALALLHDTTSVALLERVLGAPSPVARQGAAWGLGELGEPARAAIENRLRSPAALDPATLGELLLAAARLRPVPSTLVAPFLTHADTGVAWRAAYALARSRVPAAARALAGQASSPSATVRTLVARAMARGTVGDSLAALARGVLDTLARDAHPHVRIAAARSLGTLGGSAIDEVLRLARDADANVRIAAVQALPATAPLSTDAVVALWSADTSLVFRRAVLPLAVRGGIALPAVSGWRADADWRRRAALAEAHGAGPAQSVLRALDPFLRDRDGRVRAAAFDALGGWLDSTAVAERVRSALVAGFQDADPYARASALGAVGRRPLMAEGERALAAYQLGSGDPQATDARLAALRLLAALWARDSVGMPASLRSRIEALPSPGDPLERAAVQGSSLFRHWQRDTKGTARAASWYEGVGRRYVLGVSFPLVTIRTDRGDVELVLYGPDAPLTVENFVSLARRGYFRGTRFHRVVPAFVAQDGDPRGDGNGGPGYAIRDELNRWRYGRGTLGMALSGPNTGGSQFFMTLAPQPHLDGHYTVFGQVVRGFEVLDALVQGDAIRSIDVR